jgi:hypothetical protein
MFKPTVVDSAVADPKDGQAPAAVVNAKEKARMIGERRKTRCGRGEWMKIRAETGRVFR